ncbi:MAG: prepilin-type N-terminal cleavage/methylation domain-containing protein, partial [Candidatus Paceibacteria bacterium]
MKQVIYKNPKNSGQSLIEILVAVAVGAIIFGGVAALIIVALQANKNSREQALAQSLIQDMSASVRAVASQDWHKLWGSSGIVSYFAFDEGSNEKAFEPVSGNNSTVTAGSGGSYTSVSQMWQASSNCKAGKCLAFDGTDDYV